jgi:hypothetical protein
MLKTIAGQIQDAHAAFFRCMHIPFDSTKTNAALSQKIREIESECERSLGTLPSLSPQPTVIRRSRAAGGTGGQPFDEKLVNMQAAPITGLTVTVARSVADQRQRLLASVQAHWSDIAGPVHGGTPGAVIINPETRTITFSNDESVRQLIIFHRRFNWPDPAKAPVWVSGIKVRTSNATYAFGDVDGTATECILASSEQIIGFFGRAGAYVDALGCLIR